MNSKTVVLFRSNNLDAFYAAFIYWWLFGKYATSSSPLGAVDLANLDKPRIIFREVDVFEDPSRYFTKGDTVISIGLNMEHTSAFNQFFSYENDATFSPMISAEGCTYYYDQKAKLTELMLKSLVEAGHVQETDKNFTIMNQFFRFYDGRGNGFELHSDVASNVLAYFPHLVVEDFSELNKLIEDPIGFMRSVKRQRTPEAAVADYIYRRAGEAESAAKTIPVLYPDKTVLVTMINTDLVASPGAKMLFAAGAGQGAISGPAVLLYQFTENGVRVKYYSSPQCEDALQIFPSDGRKRVGNSMEAEWNVSERDLFSLMFGAMV
jgi:hypothetical protein